MTHCLNCASERIGDQCDACGLTTDAAEVLFRRRLLQLTAVFVVGSVIFLPVSHLYPPLELDGIFIFVGALVFAGLSLAVTVDRRARRGQEIEALRRIFVGLVPVPWLLAGLLLVNGKFDSTPPVSHTVSVVGKFTMPGTLRSTRLAVTSWRPGRTIERVPVMSSDFHRFDRGDVVEIRVQEGLVGIPWVYNVHRK